MTTEELQRLANDMADSECLHIPTSTNAVLGIARELIAARRVVEVARKVDKQHERSTPWKSPFHAALSAYEEAKG
mgnify:CR=1 FL=1